MTLVGPRSLQLAGNIVNANPELKAFMHTRTRNYNCDTWNFLVNRQSYFTGTAVKLDKLFEA